MFNKALQAPLPRPHMILWLSLFLQVFAPVALSRAGEIIPNAHKWFNNKAEIEKRQPPKLTPYGRLRRAGHPHRIAPWARCQPYHKYDGYYVGGGATVGGEYRDVGHEGTWGWDYTPWYSRVRLNWWHGRHQGGEGQYETDRKNNPFRP